MPAKNKDDCCRKAAFDWRLRKCWGRAFYLLQPIAHSGAGDCLCKLAAKVFLKKNLRFFWQSGRFAL